VSIPNYCPFCNSENIIFFGNSFSAKDADGDWFIIEEYICEDCKETFFIN
jgi:transposase-like protein